MEHEIIDEYNKRGEKIGIVDKAIAHKEGRLHKAVHVWVLNDKNEILLQYRCAQKALYPNTWDCSFAGHIGAGESSINAVLREGKEELGINVDLGKLNFIMTNKESTKYEQLNSNEFVDIYILKQNIDIDEISFQEEEVSDAKYVSLEEFWKLTNSEEMIPKKIEYMVLKERIKEYREIK